MIKMPDNFECDTCDSTTIFVLDNGEEQFAVHLEVILTCLKHAAKHGQIPPITDEWWWQVSPTLDKIKFQ